VLRGEVPPAPITLLLVKFVGGILAIGSGLALGREGPCVQMGANIAHATGKLFRRNWADCRVLMAAAAGAGLATAFNAPIAGAVFVIEELVQRFERRIAIAALAASATAIAMARLLLGNAPDFTTAPLGDPGTASLPLFIFLGIVAGFVGVAYNRTLLGTLAAARRVDPWLSAEVRAALIGATVGIIAWFAPALVGGGQSITQRSLLGTETLALLPAIFLLRFVLGSLSYAAGAPGGLFAPMLVLGAQLGLMFGAACHFVLPALETRPEAFAVVGIAAFFTAVVRAPVTGIILVTEMTAAVTLFLPMLGACFAAMLVPTLLRNTPIYDALRELTPRRKR
jgi:CIC family chloride channel protein